MKHHRTFYALVLVLLLLTMILVTGLIASQKKSSGRSDPCHINDTTYCALNPAVRQSTLHQTICVAGWTATIRPPVSYTNPIKQRLLARGQNLHDGDINIFDYELDHRVPLELGGAAKAADNLSLEYPTSPNPKDKDENAFKKKVCAGKETLLQAQSAFIAKWLAPYPGYIKNANPQ